MVYIYYPSSSKKCANALTVWILGVLTSMSLFGLHSFGFSFICEKFVVSYTNLASLYSI
jgi:hypothetical protein